VVRSREGVVASFEDDVLAEFAALNAVALTALKAVAHLQSDPEKYLGKVLEDGLRNVEKTDYWSVPPDRRDAFLENVKARYTDAILSIRIRS
jgi:hypothetical protein